MLILTIDTTISIVAASVAVISAVISCNSYRLSKKKYEDNQPNYDLCFNEGSRFIHKNGSVSKKLLLFNLTIRNKSGFRNSLKANLEISVLRNNESSAKFFIKHNPQLLDIVTNKKMTVFPDDIELEAKESVTNWLIFEQPNLIDNSYRIDKYKVKISDLNENEDSIETVLIKDLDG